MKKLLIYCLTLALTLTAAYPLAALAQPEEDPGYIEDQEYGEITFWEYMGYDTVEEFMEWYVEYGWYYIALGNPFWAVWGEDSLEDFMEWYNVDEDQYRMIEDAWQSACTKYTQEQEQRRTDDLEELGGVPGNINIMYNGYFISFPDAVPEIIDGTTFVPAKAFMEALGAVVSYNGQTHVISAEFDDWSVGFLAGRDTMSYTEGGATRERPIDFEPYIKNGVSFIPVRAVAETFGYDVYWDAWYDSVVIVDTKIIAEEINKDFTIVNSLLKNPAGLMSPAGDDGKIYKSVLGILVSIKRFDSLDGDKTSNIKADVTVTTDGRNTSMTGSVDLSGLIDILLDEYMSDMYYYGYDDEDLEEMNEYLSLLEDEIKVELILNYDEGAVYIKAPILNALEPDFPKNAWLCIDGLDEYYDDPDADGLLDILGVSGFEGGIDVGGLLTSDDYVYTYFNQIYIYRNIMADADITRALIGDDSFVKKGEDYELKLGLDDIVEATSGSSGYMSGYMYYSMSRFELDLLIKTRDDEVVGVSGSFTVRTSTYYDSVTQTSCEFDISAEKMTIALEVHEKNSQITNVKIDSKTAETNTPVPSGPPEGAAIVYVDDLFDYYDDGYWYEEVEQLALTSLLRLIVDY